MLQRAQEIYQSVLVCRGQHLEVRDHSIGLGTIAGMGFDRSVQIRCPPVVQEKQALTDTP